MFYFIGGQTSSPAASEDLQSSFVKQEPLSDEEYLDSYAFDNYLDPFADDYNRSMSTYISNFFKIDYSNTFRDAHMFIKMKYFLKGDEEDEFHEDEESNDGDLENKRYGRRHWERHDEPMVSVKEEKVRYLFFIQLLYTFFLPPTTLRLIFPIFRNNLFFQTDEISNDGDFDSTADFESTLPLTPQLQPQTKQEPKDDDDIFNNLNSFGED